MNFSLSSCNTINRCLSVYAKSEAYNFHLVTLSLLETKIGSKYDYLNLKQAGIAIGSQPRLDYVRFAWLAKIAGPHSDLVDVEVEFGL